MIGKRKMNQEEEEIQIKKQIKEIPGLYFWESPGHYEVQRIVKKGNVKIELAIEYEELEDDEYLWVNYIEIRIRNREIGIYLIEYDDNNYNLVIHHGKEKIKLENESDYGEKFYALGFTDIYDVFINIFDFVKERVEDILFYHKNEIKEEVRNKIEELLNQI